MEEVVILDADGRPVKGMQLDRNTIHLGEANGGYMGCTKESVIELQQERLERFTKNRKAHQKECMSAACDITPIMLAGFDNPYDEIHNLILQGYNNVIEAQGLFYRVVNQDAEMRRLRRRVIEEMTAKEMSKRLESSVRKEPEIRRVIERKRERFGYLFGNIIRWYIKVRIN